MASIVVWSGRLWRVLRWVWRGESCSGSSVGCIVGDEIAISVVLLVGGGLMMVAGEMETSFNLYRRWSDRRQQSHQATIFLQRK